MYYPPTQEVQLQLCDYVLSILLIVNKSLKNQAEYKHTVGWENFAVKIISRFVPSAKLYNMIENQVSLAVTLWLSGVFIDPAFTLGGVDVCAEAYLSIIAA